MPESAHHERLEPAPWEPQDARGPHVLVCDHSRGPASQHHGIHSGLLPESVSSCATPFRVFRQQLGMPCAVTTLSPQVHSISLQPQACQPPLPQPFPGGAAQPDQPNLQKKLRRAAEEKVTPLVPHPPRLWGEPASLNCSTSALISPMPSAPGTPEPPFRELLDPKTAVPEKVPICFH